MSSPYDIDRFVQAQEAGGTYEQAERELVGGRKRSHWMWFVFPQLAGLGRSEMSKRYGISALAEARAYLDHPVLGARLRRCARLVADSSATSAEAIFGPIDALKLQSSMTLFLRSSGEPVFSEVLAKYFDARADAATDQLLADGR